MSTPEVGDAVKRLDTPNEMVQHPDAHKLSKLHERFLAERPEAGARVTRR